MSNTLPAWDNSKRQRKMDRIDSLPAAMRSAVHDLGWNIVKQFMDAGINDAKVIRRLVNVVRQEDKSPWTAGKWDGGGF